MLRNFLNGINVLPVFGALDVFAKEKARLRKAGTLIDDFDLLIGATAVAHKMILVTNNINHLQRIAGLTIEDRTKLEPGYMSF